MTPTAPVPPDLYADYIRQIRQCEHTDSINEFLFDLNTHCHGYDREIKRAVLARLVEDGILTATDQASDFAINRSQLPSDTRNPYDTALAYLAHRCRSRSLDHHALLYRAEVYAQADREMVLRRLMEDGYLDDQGRILRRPPGSTIETHYYQTERAEASVVIAQHGDGWTGHISCSITTKDSEGFGVSGPVHSQASDFTPNVFADRAAALRAAFAAVALQAEKTAIEASLSPTWRTGGVKEARAIRAWAEFTLGEAIPAQLPVSYAEDRKALLTSVNRPGTPPVQESEEAAQFALF